MAEKQMDELKQIFPMKLRQVMEKITWDVAELEEIRIRIGQPVQFITAGDAIFAGNANVPFAYAAGSA